MRSGRPAALTMTSFVEWALGVMREHTQHQIVTTFDRETQAIFASNYFDRNQIRQVAERTGARAVIVPENTGGAPGVNTYFDLLNTWVSGLAAGFGGGAS